MTKVGKIKKRKLSRKLHESGEAQRPTRKDCKKGHEGRNTTKTLGHEDQMESKNSKIQIKMPIGVEA